MTIEEVKKIITEDENAKVDFKREWYKNSTKDELKNEFIKDMFSLANGDIHSIDKVSYLIIGVTDGTKEIFDFDKSEIPRSLNTLTTQLLQILNNYAQPEFLNLDINWYEIGENKEVLVLSVKPHNRLISLSKDLILPPKEMTKAKDDGTIETKIKVKTDKKGTVYYRIGETIQVASADVIEDFRKAFKGADSDNGVIINIKGDVNGIGTVTGGTVTQTLNFTKQEKDD